MKTAAQIVRDFEIEVREMVKKAWPKLISEELLKLSNGTKSISKPSGESFVDRASTIKQLSKRGLTQNQIARKLGCSQGYVSRLLNPPKVKMNGSSVGSAAQAVKKYGSKAAAARAFGIAESTFRDQLAREQHA